MLTEKELAKILQTVIQDNVARIVEEEATKAKARVYDEIKKLIDSLVLHTLQYYEINAGHNSLHITVRKELPTNENTHPQNTPR